jgi:hypothetical protein
MADTVAERPYRRGWVHISDQALLDGLPVPKDARIVAVRHVVNSGNVRFLLESDEYALVPEGGVVPVLSPPVAEPTP